MSVLQRLSAYTRSLISLSLYFPTSSLSDQLRMGLLLNALNILLPNLYPEAPTQAVD